MLRFISSLATLASVVMKQSMVAMFGQIMPAPLQMPPMRKLPFLPTGTSTAKVFGRVSLVMMARMASSLPLSFSLATASGTLGRMRSIGSGMPMMPVEHTSTWRIFTPISSATALVIALASWMP